MSRPLALLSGCLLLLGAAVWGPSSIFAQDVPHCAPGQEPEFVSGFRLLHDLLGDRMGEPITCEFPDPAGTGDTLQQTTTGLAFWRKATNTPTFTNGWDRWALTERGLVYWTGEEIDPPATAVVVGEPVDQPTSPILALYYPWYDPTSFGPNAAFQPLADPYQSDDPALIEQHILQALGAGIDGFVVAWDGAGGRTDRNFRQVLELGARHGLQATIYFETHNFVPFGAEEVVAQLRAVYAQYLDEAPRNLVRLDGRPVLFFWATRLLPLATWDWIREQVDPEHRAVWIAEGDVYAQLAGDTFQGLHFYSVAWSEQPARTLANAAAQVRRFPGKLWVPTAMPGYDDTRDPHKLAAGEPTFARDRRDGGYLTDSFRGAVASDPDWAILIASFNEWFEGHQIEPAQEYGTFYLDLLGRLVNEFRASR